MTQSRHEAARRDTVGVCEARTRARRNVSDLFTSKRDGYRSRFGEPYGAGTVRRSGGNAGEGEVENGRGIPVFSLGVLIWAWDGDGARPHGTA